MKKIIDGKVFNTETATCVGEWSNGDYCNDFKWASEKLYKKKNGEFFLFGEGGPMSTYAESVGNNSWTGGLAINPLTVKEAYDWAMENLAASKFEEIFGTVSEDNKNHLLSVIIPETTFLGLKSIASANDKKISKIITQLVLTNS